MGIRLIQNQKKLEHLREIILESEAEFARNGGVEDSDEFWDDLNAEVDELVKTGQAVDPDPDVWP